MKQSLFILFLTINSGLLFAQNYESKQIDANITPTEATYLGTFQPKADVSGLYPELKGVREVKNEGENQKRLTEYKDSLNAVKRAAIGSNMAVSNKTTQSIDPVRTSEFQTISSTSTPMDNSIAIGKGGEMVVVINSSLRVYNKSGSPTQARLDFPNFWSSVTTSNDMCDPLAYFDAKANRFIIFTQVCDRVTTNNRVLVAFSATSDPKGTYHFYSFKTNLREIIGTSYPYDVWFDYPKMAVSASDVFITGNMFRNVSATDSDPVESVILQIDKAACFAGAANVTSSIYNAIPGSPFTIVPAGHGRDADYGDVMHLAATRTTFNGSFIQMFTITNKVSSNPTISLANVSVPAYGTPADGIQKGTNIVLNTGDNRGMSAMYVDGTVHFVFHSDGPGNYVAINYNRLTRSGNSWSIANKLISQASTDCAFPSVASMGWTDQDQSALIVYDYSSPSDFPGIRSLYVDHNMNVSNAIELYQGDDYVNLVSQAEPTRARWGDYSGISREHNAGTPTVWGYGMYGNAAKSWSNRVAEIKTNSWPVAIDDKTKETSAVNLYPNPVIDNWNLKLDIVEAGKLTVDIYDINGKKVREVYSKNVSKGAATFSFNKNGLSNGTYFVKISLNNSKIANEKIIVSK